MHLTNEQRTALSNEGLTTVNDFQDFNHDELLVALKNCRNLNAPIPLSAKSLTRLLVAAVAWLYYTDTGRETTATNMHFKMF